MSRTTRSGAAGQQAALDERLDRMERIVNMALAESRGAAREAEVKTVKVVEALLKEFASAIEDTQRDVRSLQVEVRELRGQHGSIKQHADTATSACDVAADQQAKPQKQQQQQQQQEPLVLENLQAEVRELRSRQDSIQQQADAAKSTSDGAADQLAQLTKQQQQMQQQALANQLIIHVYHGPETPAVADVVSKLLLPGSTAASDVLSC